MLPALSTDDYLGIVLVLGVIIIWPLRHRCKSWYYTAVAHFYSLVALLARTESFIFGIFLCLIAEDVCQATVRAVTPLIPEKLHPSKLFAQKHAPIPATLTAVPDSPCINKQLRMWMREDAEEAWKLKVESRDHQILKRQELSAVYRLLASEDPDSEIVDWTDFEMEARGRISM